MRIQPQVSCTQPVWQVGGFSLIEALVTLVVMSIGLMIGVPSFKSLQSRQHSVVLTNQLLGHMAGARSAAISLRRPTLICPTHGDGRCREDSDWSEGWMMFHDPDGNRQPELPEDVLRVEMARKTDRLSIHSTGGRPLLRYSSGGLAGGSNLTLRICEDDTIRNLIRLNNTGRARVDKTQNGQPCRA